MSLNGKWRWPVYVVVGVCLVIALSAFSLYFPRWKPTPAEKNLFSVFLATAVLFGYVLQGVAIPTFGLLLRPLPLFIVLFSCPCHFTWTTGLLLCLAPPWALRLSQWPQSYTGRLMGSGSRRNMGPGSREEIVFRAYNVIAKLADVGKLRM